MQNSEPPGRFDKSAPEPADLLDSRATARLLGTSRSTVARLHRSGVLRAAVQAPGTRGALFFRAADVERYASAVRTRRVA